MALSDFPSIDPQFTQIPLGRNLLPLDDLQASGGYNRRLILPDDVPPVLSQGWTQGPIKPRLITGQDDGSVNVYMTGQKGSAGGAAVIQPKMVNDFQSGNAGDQRILRSNIGPIAALWQLCVVFLFYVPVVAPTANLPFAFHLWLTKVNDTANQFFLCRDSGYVGAAPPTLATAGVARNLYFPVGIDPSVALGVANGRYDLWIHANEYNWDCDYQLLYT